MPVDTPLREVRRLYGIKEILGVTKNVIVCPLPFHAHANHTPSFSIYYTKDGTERWHCWGSCSRRGDIIDMVGYMAFGERYDPNSSRDVLAAVCKLREGYQPCPPDPQKSRKVEQLPYNLWKLFPLGERVIEYGRKRGLSPETLRAFGVGQADGETLGAAMESVGLEPWQTDKVYMTIPTFHFGTVLMIKLRWIDAPGKKQRFIAFPGSRPGLFGFQDVFNTTSPIAIVKGEIPKMVLWERGIIAAAAPTAGEGQIDDSWGVFTSAARNSIVIGDNDPEKVAEQLATAYERRCKVFRGKLYFPPPEFHDLDEWVLADKSAISTIRSWMHE
jgi:hypothetical protein